jgi:hypothetical protein
VTGFGSALLYLVPTGTAAGAAALYGAHHGAGTPVVTALNDLRNFSFFLSFLPLGVFTAAVAVLAMTRALALPRWVGWVGLPVGAFQLVGAAGAGMELQNFAMLLWFAWFVVLGVAMVVRRRPATVPVLRPAAA